jgi:putative transposase
MLKYDKDIHHRRSIRLRHFDYSQTGAYFVTICTWKRECVFGDISDGHAGVQSSVPLLNGYGEIVKSEWMKTAEIRTNVKLDEFVVMPNHIHGILILNNVGARHRLALPEGDETRNQTGTVIPGSVGAIVGQFKSIVTKRINKIRNTPGRPVWQRNYYERIIRDDDELYRVRQYTRENPLKWESDNEYTKEGGPYVHPDMP